MSQRVTRASKAREAAALYTSQRSTLQATQTSNSERIPVISKSKKRKGNSTDLVDTKTKQEEDVDALKVIKKRRQSLNPVTIKDEPSENHQLIRGSSPPSRSYKQKTTTYGLTPGQTPYPKWPHPTPSECQEVVRLLSSAHGAVKPPSTIPIPSLTTSGCGEVPSVLDALIRTRLSAATSDKNSSRAFAGLVKRFGVLHSGVGKGSVDWDAVRQADTKDIFEAIKSGGLADVKSKDIKKILQRVYDENQRQPRQGISEENDRTEEGQTVLSLDYLHSLSSDEAFKTLTSYPGIGPKTASCVLLFCLQRPSFAVDTHVFRLCKWLGWVPPPGDPAGTKGGPTRNSTYAHCEVRVPDELKYQLHKLLIRHGRACKRCRAGPGSAKRGDEEEGCVIEHLVNRTDGKKTVMIKTEVSVKEEDGSEEEEEVEEEAG